jgi:hypothetical protein
MTALLSVALILAGPEWETPTRADRVHGLASYYAPGVMDRVIANRGLAYDDGVALNRAGDLGRQVWLLWPSGDVDGPLPVVDCAQANHYDDRLAQDRVIEVSAGLARDRGFYGVGPAPVTVLFAPPPVWDEGRPRPI